MEDKYLALKASFHKMVKHTQTICKLPTKCLSVFDHFVGLALKGLTTITSNSLRSFDTKKFFPVT